MASNTGFINNLPKIYGMYTGGFVFFVVALAIADIGGRLLHRDVARVGRAVT